MSNERQIETAEAADRPSFTILSNGSEVETTLQILSINVKRIVNRVSTASIVLLDGDPATEDFPVSNGDKFLPGAEIEIQAGYHQNVETIFKGIVIRQGVKAYKNKPSMLKIECRDKAVKMTIGRKNKYFYESTDSDIIEEIINEIGLTPDVEAMDTQHGEFVQYNTTDWDLVLARAEANGKLIFTEDGTLRIAAPDLGQDPVLNLLYGGNIMDFELEMDAQYQYESVNAFAWDAANQELLEIEGAPPSGTTAGNVSSTDLAEVIGLSSFDLRHAGQIKDTELQAWADAQLLKSHLAKIKGRIKIQGVATAKPGSIIEIGGAGDRFNGPAFVAGVQHDINVRNWETNIEVGLSSNWFTAEHPDVKAPPANGLLPAVNGLQIALVTALEGDPEGEDRIQVRIPMINPSEEGIWARVACLDAGDNRGTFFRPEIGDEVVLGFLDDDPRNGVVLGMLNSSAKPAPITATDDNHEKGIFTRSEMKILFDDDKKSMTLETPNGNKVVLSDDEGGITLEDENGNKIVLSSDGIAIESANNLVLKASADVNLEGVNVSQKASAAFKAEGSAGAELSSSANAVIKGAMVQIN